MRSLRLIEGGTRFCLTTCIQKGSSRLGGGKSELSQSHLEVGLANPVKGDSGSDNAFIIEANDVDELHFQVVGVIKDVDRLKSLFDLFAAVLDQLCRIGSAYKQEPGVTL
jgi:hypothetical protein